jgi:hypothetical protein
MVERQVGIKDALISMINERMDDWDTKLEIVAHAYRTTKNIATGFTPFFMLYGRECSGGHPNQMERKR